MKKYITIKQTHYSKRMNRRVSDNMGIKARVEASSELYKTAVQNAMDSIMITSPELDEPGPIILYVNTSFTRMTGYSQEEAIGRSPRFLQGKNTDRQILKKAGRLLRRGKPIREEIVNYRKDGKEYVIEWHISPVRAKGKVVNWVSIQRDITERKRLEDSLRKQKLAVEEKVQERTQELESMKQKLENYARKLEKRLVSMEKRMSGLSDREKKVLAEIANSPNSTDTELALSSGIKRPTFTSIRQRLMKRSEFSELYVPHPLALGCEAVSIEYGEIPLVKARTGHIDERFRKKSVIYISSGTHFAAVTFHSRFRDAYESDSIIIPSEFLHISFGNALAGLFGKEAKAIGALPERTQDTEIMKALIEHPGWSMRSIADKLGLSVATVSNARNSLLNGAIMRDIMPKIKGFYPIALVHSKSKLSAALFPFLKAETPKESIYIGWAKDEDELIESVQDSKVVIFGREPKMLVSFRNAL